MNVPTARFDPVMLSDTTTGVSSMMQFILSIYSASSSYRMPPRAKDLSSVPEDAVLGLQDWLKLLSVHGVSMRTAMALAAKA